MMNEWIKDNKEMVLTIISGILLLMGVVLQIQDNLQQATFTYIIAFVIGGYYSAKAGYLDLFKNKRLNADILMILAAIGAGFIGHWLEGAILIFIFSLAESLEQMAMNKTSQSIQDLMNIAPDTARLVQADGQIVEVPTADLKIGDVVQVPKGEAIPIDGFLMSDYALVDESAISGEPLPVNKKHGDQMIGGTINQAESFDLEVNVSSSDTLFAKVIRMVEEAQSNPSKTATRIEGIEDAFVKTVLIGVPLFILFLHFGFNYEWSHAFYRGMVLLTVASPCALVASSSPANLSTISRSAKEGILFKGANAVEQFSEVDAIIFDKTGTLTIGQPQVQTSHYDHTADQELVDQIVKTAEASSTHPIAQALLTYLDETASLEFDQFEDITGKGFVLTYQGAEWKIGNLAFTLGQDDQIDSEVRQAIAELEGQGHTIIYVSRNGAFQAYYALEDTLKEDALETVTWLNNTGIHTVMLTGDNYENARHVADLIGIDEVHANLLPEDKVRIVQETREMFDTVAMVGDGINDAPALATADIGIAMGSGTDIAMEAADVVLMKDDLDQIPFAYRIATKSNRIVMFNISFSIGVILLLIMANLLEFINLPIGVIGHEGSTILVILNSLRLLGYHQPKFP